MRRMGSSASRGIRKQALSAEQQRLWFEWKLNPDSSAFNVALQWEIYGQLDVNRFRRALGRVHELLVEFRSCFVEERGVPWLLEFSRKESRRRASHRPDPEIPEFEFEDFMSCAETTEDRRSLALARHTEIIRSPMPPTHYPTHRAVVLRYGPDRFFLAVTAHHIANDGPSAALAMRLLARLYNHPQVMPWIIRGLKAAGILSDRERCQAAIAKAYPEARQREGELHWVERLRGASLNLNFGPPAGVVRTTQGRRRRFSLDSSTSSAIRTIAKAERTTVFVVLCALYGAWLHRVTRAEDIVLGYPTSTRPKGAERACGFFANTLLLRINLSGTPTLRQLIHQVSKTRKEDREHRWFPYSEVVRVLRREDPGFIGHLSAGIGQTVFGSVDVQFRGLDIVPTDVDYGEVQNGLVLLYEETAKAERIELALEYRTSLFDETCAEALCRSFAQLAAKATVQLDEPVEYLLLLSEADQRRILIDFNQNGFGTLPAGCVHHLVEEQSRRIPDAAAVEVAGAQLSYAELEYRASRLACHLQGLGVGPEVLVGIALERSVEMVVGILAILKAGGAYLPLDPGEPKDRLQFMIEDSNPDLLLTLRRFDEKLPGAVRRVFLDEEPTTGGLAASVAVGPGNLAYVIYTSGSTGKPKGVLLEHGGLANLALVRGGALGIAEGVRVLQVASPCFDVSVFEIFATLVHGGTLVLARPDLPLVSHHLWRTLSEGGIQVVALSPAALASLPDMPLPDLRALIVGGETCPEALVRQWSVGRRFFNDYGPTEATVCATTSECGGGVFPPNIGRPLVNVRVHIVDERLQPVPVGMPGELVIGGVGVARGYLHRPELTAERFVTDPFADTGGQRLYRTGDLARYRDDGSIEILGRLDLQVKLRGHRIELGEVERMLATHPAVKMCAASVREDVSGDRRMVAYLVAQAGTTPKPDALRAHLLPLLPHYMIPSAFVLLPELPLTANGKVNRMALPAPRAEGQIRTLSAPRNAAEVQIADAFREILRVSEVGIEDSFFELGGHSLLAAQLIARIGTTTSLKLELKDLFGSGPPTVAGLARVARARDQGDLAEQDRPVDFDAEAQLDPEIRFNRIRLPNSNPKRILLTGATGFLGAHLLMDLIAFGADEVVCLVRARSDEDAHRRLRRVLEQHGLWDASKEKRFVALAGDLAKPRFGLSQERFDALTGEVEAIYHNGARVDFVSSYHALRAVNVLATVEVLRLAATGRPKSVHYISSVGVLEGLAARCPVLKEEPVLSPVGIQGGYGQSKWVAERLVLEAARRGLAASIYRPGRIAAHTQSGVCNQSDLVTRMMVGSIQLGLWPELAVEIDLTPVDFVSRAVIALSWRNQSGRIYHLVNPSRVSSDCLGDWLQSRGYPLKMVPFATWRGALHDATRESATNMLAPLRELFTQDRLHALAAESGPAVDCSNSFEALGPPGCALPSDQHLVNISLAYLEASPTVGELLRAHRRPDHSHSASKHPVPADSAS